MWGAGSGARDLVEAQGASVERLGVVEVRHGDADVAHGREWQHAWASLRYFVSILPMRLMTAASVRASRSPPPRTPSAARAGGGAPPPGRGGGFCRVGGGGGASAGGDAHMAACPPRTAVIAGAPPVVG